MGEEMIDELRAATARDSASERVESPKSGEAQGTNESSRPIVSVIVPAFNCATYLAESVRSVFRQTYPLIECIVIDDGSSDYTGDVLRDLESEFPHLVTARKMNGGPSAARNLGVRLSSGTLVSFLDADDVLLPDKIERQVRYLSLHPDVGVVYSDYLVVSENLQPIATFLSEMPRNLEPAEAFCYRNWFNPLVALIRKEVGDRIGGFDEDLLVAEDWDYWIRCSRVTKIAHLRGPAGLYRQHSSQLHRDYRRMRRVCIEVATKNYHNEPDRLRTAMAAVELTYAKELWKDKERAAGLMALMNCALRSRFGLHGGHIVRQLEAIGQSQLRAY